MPPSSHVKEPSVTAHFEHYAHDEWSIRDLLHWLNYPSLPISFPCFESRGVLIFFNCSLDVKHQSTNQPNYNTLNIQVKYCTILSITAAFFREKETFRQAQSRKCRARYRDVAKTTCGIRQSNYLPLLLYRIPLTLRLIPIVRRRMSCCDSCCHS